MVRRTYADISNDPSNPNHGRIGGYRNYGCRCLRCTEANRVACREYMQTSPYQRELRERRRQEVAQQRKERRIANARARESRRAAEREAKRLSLCGTRAGYKRHYERREEPCEPCRKASAKYQRELRKRRKTNAVE